MSRAPGMFTRVIGFAALGLVAACGQAANEELLPAATDGGATQGSVGSSNSSAGKITTTAGDKGAITSTEATGAQHETSDTSSDTSSDTTMDPLVFPFDRRYAVIALMKDSGTSSWVRLARYSFTPPDRVDEEFWFWSQTEHVGKTNSGVTTVGCDLTCTIYTAVGFEDGHAEYPKSLTGVYTYDDGDLRIDWASGSWEMWSVDDNTSVSRLSVAPTSSSATHGWGYASATDFSASVPIADVVASGAVFKGPYQQNNWGSSAGGNTSLDVSVFSLCTHAASSTETAKRYLAVSEGRKTYFNRQNYAVDPDLCIGVGGGHLNPLLQVIDDAGEFRGWVGVEASVYQPKHGSSIVAIYDLTNGIR